ncbi:MAG: hypothetical protein HKL98_11295 [Burkholderiales bacterium]|nr:hypothetical protein [Burkholderiales bacterium]
MQDMEALKSEIRKLNAQATQLKMDLHDLAEELPVGWEKIPEVAARTHEAYEKLMALRRQLSTT